MSLGSPRPSPSLISFSSSPSSSRASTPTLAPSQLPPDDKFELADDEDVHTQVITTVDVVVPSATDLESNNGMALLNREHRPVTNAWPVVDPPATELGFGRLLVIHAAYATQLFQFHPTDRAAQAGCMLISSYNRYRACSPLDRDLSTPELTACN